MPKRGVETQRSFVVFEVYYKHGQYEVNYFRSVGALENYLNENLERYCGEQSCDYEEVLKEINDDDEEARLQKLIAIVVKMGKAQVEEQVGIGAVAVEELASK